MREYYYCKNTHKKRLKRRLLITMLALFAFLFCALMYIRNVVNPIIVSYAESKVKVMTVTAVNNAIMKVFDAGISYSDIVTVEKDGGGNITMLLANTEKIGAIARNTARESQSELDGMGEQALSLSLGSLTGAPLLTGLGPQVAVRIVPAGGVICRFRSVFESAGINQTIHKIYIEVCAFTDVVLPVSAEKIESNVEILITEAVLLGKIPDTYIQFGYLGTLDFLPE